MIVSIDGPAASGKSTTAKLIAEKLDLLYLDTGAMYRAVALYLHENSIDIDDFLVLESSLDQIYISFQVIDRQHRIFLNDRDVSDAIRSPEMTRYSSQIATIKIIRKHMVGMQRSLAENHNVILDGRDIGSVVFPNADFKFFLTATLESRAKRRYDELVATGVDADLDRIKQDLIWRDQNDMQREEAPLKKPHGAIEVNTTDMTIAEQVDYILRVITKYR
jgi:cytidylate kinase